MERDESLDFIDRGILKILSFYDHLNLLELWFEIGEAGIPGPVTKGEVLSRLHSLMVRGYVERIARGDGNVRWALKEGGYRSKRMLKEGGEG